MEEIRERQREAAKRSYAKNRERNVERKRAYRKANPRAHRPSVLLKKFGITLQEYDAMLLAQGGRCAICRSADPGNGRAEFAVDHDHETDKIRGLLCNNCNLGIGQLGDDPERLTAAAEYLSKHKPPLRLVAGGV